MAKKAKSTKEAIWLPIDDAEIRHIWEDPDGKNQIDVAPSSYADMGTPICGDDSEHDGDDMVYVRTEVSPRVAEAIKFRATVEPVLQHIFDVLYFDSGENCFDPDKEWDSADDFLESIAGQIRLLYGDPKARSKKYPELKHDG